MLKIEKKGRNNTSGIIGVHLRKGTDKFIATIRSNRKHYHIGDFSDKFEAGRARDDKAIELHGKFAYLNFPERYPEHQQRNKKIIIFERK